MKTLISAVKNGAHTFDMKGHIDLPDTIMPKILVLTQICKGRSLGAIQEDDSEDWEALHRFFGEVVEG